MEIIKMAWAKIHAEKLYSHELFSDDIRAVGKECGGRE